MPNLYADIGSYQRYGIPSGAALDADDVTVALALIESASRAIDSATRRKFYNRIATRYLRGDGWRTLELDEDLISLSALLVDEDGDRVYEITLAESTDYELGNTDNEDDSEPPFDVIRLLEDASISAFPRGRRSVKVTGIWGYSAAVAAMLTSAGVAVTGTLADAADTTLATSAVASPEIAAGMTLKIESEQVYILSGTASPFVIQRGVNGTVAAAHAAAALSRYVYEPDIVNATLLQAARFWKRRETPIQPIIAGPGIGSFVGQQQLDEDIAAMISRLRRLRGA